MMRSLISRLVLPAGIAACASSSGAARATPDVTPAGSDQGAAAVFFSRMSSLCGGAFEGRLTDGQPQDSIFRTSRLVMHVRRCSPSEIRIPFHVGENRSRTWVLSRTANGLRLKHDHRHEDGTPDRVTQYGGDARESGSVSRQEFPADSFTVALLPGTRTAAWAMEIVSPERFAYSLRRGSERFVRIEFDLSRRVAVPPAPWGAEP